MEAPSEKLLYSIAIYTGTGIQKPDYLVTIDADPEPGYSQVISRLEMPGLATNCTIWVGMPVHRVMMIQVWNVNTCFCQA